MSALNMAAFRSTPLSTDPFDHVIIPGFINEDARAALSADYPRFDIPGSVPVSELTYGPAFDAVIREMRGPEMTAAFAEKFQIDLSDRPTMITVRGNCRRRDGQIHTDSKTKLITVLIYMNEEWEDAGGRLRLLRSPDDIENYVVELPPDSSTMLAFRNGANAWHGHKPYEGPRRALQLNWVTDEHVVEREQRRHRWSARLKRLNPFARAA